VTGETRKLMDKYGVSGFPGLVLAAPSGESVGRPSRSSSALKAEFKKTVAKHAIKVDWKKGIAEAMEAGKKESKLTLVFFNDPAKKHSPMVEGFFYDKEFNSILKDFVVTQHEVAKKCKVCRKYSVRKGPEVHLYDPNTGKAIKKFRKLRSAEKLKKMIAEEVKQHEKARARAKA